VELKSNCRIYLEYDVGCRIIEAFEKYSILFKTKEDENFNRRHTSSISRIEI